MFFVEIIKWSMCCVILRASHDVHWFIYCCTVCTIHLLSVLCIYCLYYVYIVCTMHLFSVLVSIVCTIYLLSVLRIHFLYYLSDIFTWRWTTSYLDAGRLARSQYPEAPASGHLDTGFSWFSWVLEQILGWFSFSFPSCHYIFPM
jgi:hypothetical protein